MNIKYTVLSMCLGLAAMALSGCASNGGWDVGLGIGGGSVGGGSHSHAGVGVHKSSGPPAHAPAHGYRKKHQHDNVELVYDSGLGVYVALGFENTFFHGDVYYRGAGERWEVSTSINGPWNHAELRKVPKKLKNKHKHKNKGRKQNAQGNQNNQ